jgi:hypothetical protein
LFKVFCYCSAIAAWFLVSKENAADWTVPEKPEVFSRIYIWAQSFPLAL